MAQITKYPASYSTSGTISGTKYRNCIGKSSSTTASGNDYASRNSTATISYAFNFSDIPENAVIDSVEVIVGGHCESTTNSQEVARLQLYSGNTAKGSQVSFTKRTKQLITMNAGEWTREELQSAKLNFTIGYYGGLVNGVDFTVTYHEEASEKLYFKQNGAWVGASKVYQKVNGSWQEVTDLESVLSDTDNYIWN